MSRIHEALKKAEQERGLRSPVATDPAAPIEPVMPGPAKPLPTDAPSLAVHAPPSSEVPTLDSLMRITPSSWRPDTKVVVAFQGSHGNLGTEEFRSLRSRLYQNRDAGPLRRVLVTSALPQEGKTYVAANLALSIVRQKERRALLIDGDLRRSRLHDLLGTHSSPGMTDYLKGAVGELAIIQRGAIENLFFIPGGKSVPNAAELISNGRFKLLVDRLTPFFDWIIIDSPPCVAMSDASLLAEFCDGVLIVVAAGKTPFDLAQKTREQLRKFRTLGVVLNQVDPQYTGGHYYYGYYMGDEGEEKAKKG